LMRSCTGRLSGNSLVNSKKPVGLAMFQLLTLYLCFFCSNEFDRRAECIEMHLLSILPFKLFCAKLHYYY
jgi:hypothetical protein